MRTTAAAYSPWRDAAERYPDIHIARCPLPVASATWVPEQRVILIEQSLPRAERNAVLAHEIAHIDLGHRGVDFSDWTSWKHEVAADKLAASRLISVEGLIAGARECDTAETLAEYLEVPVALLRLRVQTLTADEQRQVQDALALWRDYFVA